MIPLLLITSCFSTFHLVYTKGYERTFTIKEQEYDALLWVRRNTKNDSTFLTYHYIDIEATKIREHITRNGRGYSWVTTIGERRVVLNIYGGFLSRGYDYNEFVEIAYNIDEIFTIKDLKKTVQLIKLYPISYIYVGPDEQEQYRDAVNKFENQNYFESVYFNDLVKIYTLK